MKPKAFEAEGFFCGVRVPAGALIFEELPSENLTFE
jgi:hypothetical protein